ncbi:MAG: hypothetical protein KatS3mg034_0846 [Vicingaceae bacterium]|nr:MAG: hypothetical protein KatS3mg034_0846 [Vicingaceae bacterium]
MKEIIKCIEKYIEITNDNGFIIHWKKLSEKLIEGIQSNYSNREDKIVKIIESIINRVGTFKTQGKGQKYSISTSSIFIHGNKSQVEFIYYGEKKQRELGDIIFILSVVYNGKKYFEKMTINQVKKSKDISWRFSNQSAKEQLYLLSRFPTFKGIKRSFIPSKEYNLSNNYGCLGTHGLLYSPGDFALVSSKELEVLLSMKNTLRLDDLLKLERKAMVCSCCIFHDVEECIYIFHKFIHYYPRCLEYFPFVCDLPVLGNKCISYNVYDFSNKYLLGHIGELIYAKELPYNNSAFQFLQDLLNAIGRKANRENLSDNISKFMSSFYKYEYADSWNGGGIEEYGKVDYEDGGIGIIHTNVNLGEGE